MDGLYLFIAIGILKRDKYTNGNWINFYYDGTGILLKRKLSNGVVWRYIDDLVIKNDTLYQINQDEGRVIYDIPTDKYTYEFEYRDHLGNLRLSFRDSSATPVSGAYKPPVVVQVNDYDPWGMDISSFQKNNQDNFKYSTKERISDFNLGWDNFGNRMYSADIGRFTSIDRFAEKYPMLTGYQYAANNPIKYIDVNGDSLWISHGKNNYLYNNGKLSLNGQEYTGKLRGFLKETVKALNTIGSTEDGAKTIESLQTSENNFNVKEGDWSHFEPSSKNDAEAIRAIDEGQNPYSFAPAQSKMGSGGNIFYNPYQSATTNGTTYSPTIVLAHESFHAFDSNKGQLDGRSIEVNGVCCEQRQEIRATYFQNRVSQQLGSSYPLREYYGGTSLPPMPPRLIDSSKQPINVQPPSLKQK